VRLPIVALSRTIQGRPPAPSVSDVHDCGGGGGGRQTVLPRVTGVSAQLWVQCPTNRCCLLSKQQIARRGEYVPLHLVLAATIHPPHVAWLRPPRIIRSISPISAAAETPSPRIGADAISSEVGGDHGARNRGMALFPRPRHPHPNAPQRSVHSPGHCPPVPAPRSDDAMAAAIWQIPLRDQPTGCQA
jgi:hypothetical protein